MMQHSLQIYQRYFYPSLRGQHVPFAPRSPRERPALLSADFSSSSKNLMGPDSIWMATKSMVPLRYISAECGLSTSVSESERVSMFL